MSARFLPLMVVARAGAAAIYMAYAASLPFLLEPWGLSGSEAGSIQAAFNLCYAVSLLAFSWAADRYGPGRIFVSANWAAALLFVACACLARSYASGLLWFSLVALALGGSYTPSLMLVARAVPPARRGFAIGWVLAGSSIGYFCTVAAAPFAIPMLGYAQAWLLLALVPALAAIAGTMAAGGVERSSRPENREAGRRAARRTFLSRPSLLLTGGYTAHCWELLGMWAWAPAFLTLSLARQSDLTPVAVGLLVAGTLHLSGAFATLVGGIASDRYGRRLVLVAMSLAGALLSLLFGWSAAFGPFVLLMIAALYGFATLGDSGVLSTAMTEAVDAAHLGSAFAVRSILGFGAGAVSPLVLGWILDLTNEAGAPPANWGWAFATLAIGGFAATACAVALPRDGRASPPGFSGAAREAGE